MTTDVWIILGVLGAAILLSVIAVNWWQEKKYRNQIDQHFIPGGRDLLDEDLGLGPVRRRVLPGERLADNQTDPAVTQAAKQGEKQADSDSNSESAHALRPDNVVRTPPRAPMEKREPGFHHAPAASPTLSKAVLASHAPAPEVELPDSEAPDSDLQAQTHEALTLSASAHTMFTESLDAYKTSPDPFTPLTAADFAVDPQAAQEKSVAQSVKPHSVTTLSDSAQQAMHQSEFLPPVTLPTAVHPGVDFTARLLLSRPVGLSVLHSKWSTFGSTNPAVRVWVANAGQQWYPLGVSAPADLACIHCMLALQMADRSGPVTAEQCQQFQHLCQQFADSLAGAELSWSTEQPLVDAQELDQFCITVDKTIEFHVIAEQGVFHATKLRGLAEAHGLQLTDTGVYQSRNSHGQLQYQCRNFEGKPFSQEMLKTAVMSGMTFEMDIPVTHSPAEVFEQMVQTAQVIAGSVHGHLMDVNRKPINDQQLDKIRQIIHHLSGLMAERQLLPGSETALRVFS